MTRSKLTFVVVMAVFLAWDWFGSRLQLDEDELLAVVPGMTPNDVRGVLGDPIFEEVRQPYAFWCKCNPEQICWRSERTTWTYT